jgi:hypothetical protein
MARTDVRGYEVGSREREFALIFDKRNRLSAEIGPAS